MFKAMDFNNEWLEAGAINNKNTPTNGNIIMKTSKLIILKKKKV